ncbi:uncharacterized protein CcaverHIS019_0702620 [Cutaneotrichosporon cavernicola]|uniref:Protein kinase domain-containing protein n=1 Tax=Cutaneotrichosporon cavernicola TaxID=279322 RepID=A0AA48QYS6_9TREE|nr:uncharacterized protein CcaverHIS019_0702620 [Cutaneotrichosporon cavernicola]BEI94681.1 hypothetical protein CcaverHIS019_0702620 [Cutaneotrichosporon cavernicola]BEJ02456.1 hypothetical protein CcaverHIS631_0702510 [Cutaneotrichosporon cavernicola]BEJ10215.1 hypothetical protein CcaverHIS641_0702500 [Cutaneotrichosporon cavernicola]
MSRPSSYHSAPTQAANDDFALPLYQQPTQSTLAYQSPQYQGPPLNPNVPPPRSPRTTALPPPPLSSGHSLQANTPQRHSVHTTHLTPSRPSGSPYSAAQPYTPTPATTNGSATSSQRQSMHFPAYGTSYGASDHPPTAGGAGGAGSGGTLGSLARSASLSTARRKDPFSYPSDDVESGMAGGDIGSGPAYVASAGAAQIRPGGAPAGAANQMPMPYINTNLRNDTDVVMSPPGSSGGNAVRYGSMPPPPVRLQSGSASSSSTQPPSNPYVPREGPPSDTWLHYRRSSARQSSSPQSGSVSPALVASPHSPSMQSLSLSMQDTASSPHLLTPQGTMSSPPSSGTRDGGFYHPPNQRSHSQSFIMPTGPQYEAPRSSSREAPSRQGLRPVRGWDDLKPRVNAHPQGRRADPDVPGGYLSPLKCLTAALPQTYSLCNPAFKYESSDNPRRVLTKPSKPVYNDGADNEDWDYILFVNDLLGGEHGGDRYLILDLLGQGTFGQVVKCQNMRTHAICAVKVVKNKPAYLNQSKMEVAILNLLNREHDPHDEHHILRLLDSFTHKSHLCLVFECLSSNLYELIKQNQFKGLSLQLVRVFTQQLLDCLAVLKDARLIHCDLKPENILLKTLQSPQIKVIDFGSACHELQTVYTYIQSRFYRSPEVLLGLPYSTSIDMWSLGCIVVELFLGLPIFPGTSEYNQVSRIVDMLGIPPQHQLEMGKQTNDFFNCVGVDAHGRKQYKLKPMDQYASEHRTKEQASKQYFKHTQLRDIIMEYPLTKKNAKQLDIDREMAQRRAFMNFVEGLLNLDPIKRWSPQQASKHPFITGEKYTGPFEPPTAPAKRSTGSSTAPATATTEASAVPATPSSTSSKKYGGLVQSPASGRGQRVYSDAAAYNHRLTQHQYQTAQAQVQAQSAQNAARQGPFAPGNAYDTAQQQQQQQYAGKTHVSSQHNPPTTWQHQSQVHPPTQPYHPRVPSGTSGNQGARASFPTITAPTNPPPNSYFPGSRNRANTINQMDTIPPALARLTNLGAPDPSNRSSLTPVLHREDMAEAWERRQQGGHKPSNLQHQTYAQLEYLQEQAELVNMAQQGYVMPGQYQGHHAHHASTSGPPSAGGLASLGGHHRGTQSFSGTQAYQMQPPIGTHEYRGRVPPLQLTATNEYDPTRSGSSSAAGGAPYLPTYPPAAATSQPNSATFDAFDARDTMSGLMYTPLQPTQAQTQGAYGAFTPGHAARSSFSGPYNSSANSQRNNPFAGQQPAASPRRGGHGYGA